MLYRLDHVRIIHIFGYPAISKRHSVTILVGGGGLTIPWFICCWISRTCCLRKSMSSLSSLKKVWEQRRGLPISRRSCRHWTNVSECVCVCEKSKNFESGKKNTIPSERAPLEEQNGADFSFIHVAPSSEELWMLLNSPEFAPHSNVHTKLTLRVGNMSAKHRQKSFSPSIKGL